jgi:hypothetical protein
MRDQALWQKISGEDLTTPEGEPLQQVLAQQSALGKKRAAQAVAEYRRWRYLQAILGEQAVPPTAILQVAGWHQLGAPNFNHERRWTGPGYGDTLATYAQEFGAPPPEKLWPSPATMRRGDGLIYWQGAGGVLFLGGVFTGLVVLAVPGVLLALVPTLVYRQRGPWTAGPRPSSDPAGSGTDGGGDG